MWNERIIEIADIECIRRGLPHEAVIRALIDLIGEINEDYSTEWVKTFIFYERLNYTLSGLEFYTHTDYINIDDMYDIHDHFDVPDALEDNKWLDWEVI